MAEDHYSILGIARTANEAEIRKAYRRLVLQYHPDRNPGNPEAEATFKRVAEAYHVLANEQSRASYDLELVADEDLILDAQRKAREEKLREQRRQDTELERRAAARARRPMRRYSDYGQEANEIEERDAVNGMLAGAVAATLFHYWLMPESQRGTLIPLFAWCMGSIIGGTAGYMAAGKLRQWLEEALPGMYERIPALEPFGKLVPLLGALVGTCGMLGLSHYFGEAIFTWRSVPSAIAAGTASAIGSAFGRAFTLVAERPTGKAVGVVVGFFVGAILGGLIGVFLVLFSGGRSLDLLFFEGFLAGGLGAGMGGGIASAAGSLRIPELIEKADEQDEPRRARERWG